MEEGTIAQFTVRITSTKHSSWQGSVVTEGGIFHFESELQLFRWLFAYYPELLPNTDWKIGGSPWDTMP